MATYYVDWVSGADTNNGTATGTPWKHSPGDDGATNNANITLAADDTVVFKGGVTYSGTATQNSAKRILFPNASGTSGHPITFISGHVHSSAWGTNRAVIDGGGPGVGAAKTGIYVWSKAYVTLEGFDVRNVGVPTTDAAGIEFEAAAPAGIGGIIRNCVVHDVNWTGSYVRGYGIENNHCASFLYEKNEVYNCTDKLIETVSPGTQSPRVDDAGDGIIRYNLLHNSAVHCMVLSSDNNLVYNNVIWNIHDGVITGGGGTPNPGYALKVDQAIGNKIFNNIAYNVSSGWGVLNGTDNTFAHNIIYGLGGNGGGTHGGNDEVGISCFNNDGVWTGPTAVNGNKFYNNIIYYIPSADTADKPKFVYVANTNSNPTNNEIKNNVFFALSGDTTSTVNRVRKHTSPTTSNVETVAGLEANFDSWVTGTGNVASGNVVVDPAFLGGTLASLTNLPTGFKTGYTDVATNAFYMSLSSPGKIRGQVVVSPINVDLLGNTRHAYWPGVYEPKKALFIN